MATLSDDEMSDKIQTSLRDTPYACTTLQKLSGGTANFVYRGTLSTPLADNTKTVVIKHTEPYVASHPSFKLSVNRCVSSSNPLSDHHQQLTPPRNSKKQSSHHSPRSPQASTPTSQSAPPTCSTSHPQPTPRSTATCPPRRS